MLISILIDPSIGKKFLKWVSRKISTSVAPTQNSAKPETASPNADVYRRGAGGGGGGTSSAAMSRRYGVERSGIGGDDNDEEEDFMPTSTTLRLVGGKWPLHWFVICR